MRIPITLAVAMTTATMLGCSSDNDAIPVSPGVTDSTQFQIDVTNLTHNQAISPVGVMLHSSSYQPFTVGVAASAALEMLAEGGNNSPLLNEASANEAVLDTAAGAAAIAPGGSERFMLTGVVSADKLSLVGMLVNTNDGFAALNSADLSQLSAGNSVIFHANVFDAGTEANDEIAGNLPGQGGEGFNDARNDRNFVIVHPGVIGIMDGLATSALDQSYRFDNPAVKVEVTRLQ
jgi:hypothetical protein